MTASSRTVVACTLVAALFLTLAPAACAELTTFFGEDFGLGEDTPLLEWPMADAAEAAFTANLEDPGIEDLEAFEDETRAPLPIVFPGSGITATLRGTGWIDVVPAGSTNEAGRYATSGTHYWETADEFWITFSEPIAAFGFHGVDVGDFNGSVTLTLVDGRSTDLTIPHTIGSPGGTVIYFGFFDNQDRYTRIVFGNSAPGYDYFGFDDMTVGSVEQVIPHGA